MTALWPLRPHDASAAWQSARPVFLPSVDGKRWDVRLGQTWSIDGRGTRALRDALEDDFGMELTDAFDHLRFPWGGRQLLLDAGEQRQFGDPIYSADDLQAACSSGDATRFTLLGAPGAPIRTIRRLMIMSRRGDLVTAGKPIHASDALLRYDDVIEEGKVQYIDVGSVRALAPIVPELIIGIRPLSRS